MAAKAATAAAAVQADEFETVFLPKMDKNDDAQYVAVNGRRILVRKGEPVQVPKAFAEVIRNSQAADKQAQAYINSVSKD